MRNKRSKRRLPLLGLALIMNWQLVYADVDAYQWCQVHIDNLKMLSSLDKDVLVEIRKRITYSESIKELSKATGKPLEEMVPIIMEHQGIPAAEAEKQALNIFKGMEVRAINDAIRLHGNSNELVWTEWFDKCVRANKSP